MRNWNLKDTGLPESVVKPFLTQSQPQDIIFYTRNKLKQILPVKYESNEKQSQQTLFIGNTESVKKRSPSAKKELSS